MMKFICKHNSSIFRNELEKSVDYHRLPVKKIRKKSQVFGSNDNIASENNVQNEIALDVMNGSSEDEEFVLGNACTSFPRIGIRIHGPVGV